jgi:AMP phosphorylase
LEFRARPLDLESFGKYIVVLGVDDAKRLGIISSDRVSLKFGEFELIAILNTASVFPPGIIGVFKEVRDSMGLENGDKIEVTPAERPESLNAIREKILGEKLVASKVNQIVEDVVQRHLSDIELASFVTALQIHGTSMEEVEALSWAMIKNGRTINFGRTPILDKHSIGGVPGDKTTLLVVPIVSAAGYTIPKSSSRAITSPAGTADRMEALSPVNLRMEKILGVVEDVGACIVWGGALDLAPADDIFIQVEYPLSIDPLLLPSILSKKKAMGSSHVVVDIPAGREAKIHSLSEAHRLAGDFIVLGSRLGMHIECAITEGEQPIGYAVGPNLEAREALMALGGRGPADLKDKAITLAGILLEMVGEKDGNKKAKEILSSGKAEEKMREIIQAQGGNPDVKPDDLITAENWIDVKAKRDGRVLWIHNRAIAQIARMAGAPGDKGAGLLIKAKMGDEVKEGTPILRIFTESHQQMEQAVKMAEELAPIVVGNRVGERMLISQIKGVERLGREFILER